MVDHVGLKVRDFRRSRDFYAAALGALGIELLAEFEAGGVDIAGFGTAEGTRFWLSSGKLLREGDAHVAFNARSRAEVHAFHMIGLATGGRDNGAPGLRPQYHPDYYAAFLLDPDGNNVEAMCMGKEGA